MSGGYGKVRWGKGPWGGAERSRSGGTQVFEEGLYPVPAGLKFGRVYLPRFSGEPSSGPLSEASGLIFFSASLDGSADNSVDLAVISFTSVPRDEYRRPRERSSRLFRFGGGPGFGTTNPSRTNATLYRTQPLEYTAVATLVQTLPPGPTTVIKIP